ncbi:MAG: dTMP kinase [Spirochaetaceae bacterium 4572_7]|nr:MAG: dTMP kinase [Spirochaetaceae bacterium 4572_7]
MKTEVIKNFVVLEGLDGSGTTTQLNILTKMLEKDAISIIRTFEPTDNPIGKLIRRVLRKELSLEPKSVSKLFVADRHEHIYGANGIVKNTSKGNLVLCDRYLFSSLAYQSPECGFDYVKNINEGFPLPEHLFFFNVDVDICQERIVKRGDAKELFDAHEYQLKVHKNYLKALELYKDSKMNIHIIDGTKSPKEISNEIYSIIRQ